MHGYGTEKSSGTVSHNKALANVSAPMIFFMSYFFFIFNPGKPGAEDKAFIHFMGVLRRTQEYIHLYDGDR